MRFKNCRPIFAAGLMLLSAWSAAAQDSSTVFRRIFSAITTAQTSANLPNIGQSMHLMTVIAPTATADVTAVQLRIEASYNNSLWFPISRDVSTITYTAGTGAYAVERANAAYPFVRLRALTVNASFPLTVHYTGSSRPIGNVFYSGGALLAGPAAAAFDKASWGLCTTAVCAVAANITVPYLAIVPSRFDACYLAAKTGPTGASLIIDVLRNGTSIFGAGSKLVIAAGATTGNQTTFASPNNAIGDQITVDIIQVGSTAAGRDVSIACRLAL